VYPETAEDRAHLVADTGVVVGVVPRDGVEDPFVFSAIYRREPYEVQPAGLERGPARPARASSRPTLFGTARDIFRVRAGDEIRFTDHDGTAHFYRAGPPRRADDGLMGEIPLTEATVS